METLRSDWIARTHHAIELLTTDLSTVDVRGSIHLLRHFVDTLEAPPDPLHGAVLSTMLMDVCGRVVHALHEQNPPARCTCDSAIWAHVGRETAWHEDDPRDAFRDWLIVFFDSLETQHPADAAVRAAQIIRREPDRAWTIDALATAAHSRPEQLRRAFIARFGLRPADYVHLARVTRAIGLLRTQAKVEDVAHELGYKSKKDLYAALSRWANATPTEVRALSADKCASLERELKLYCLRGVIERMFFPQYAIARDDDGGRGAGGTRAFRR